MSETDRTSPDETLPRARFLALWRRLGARQDGDEVFTALAAAWAGPGRFYHTTAHLLACLCLLDECRALLRAADEVELALWFHDAVYDTHASDNEARSARWAEERLTAAGAPSAVASRVAELVRATERHEAADTDGAILLDIDLSILGEDRETFAAFEQAIRAEYAWVDDALYRAGRDRVLARFEARPVIFTTAALHRRFESQARSNLAWARARLATR